MSVNKIFNKPWNNESMHNTFEEADSVRDKLLKAWKLDEKFKGMQVKIKYMPSKNWFAVKTRLHPDFEVKKEKGKKNGKNSKRNKKNSSGGMFDPTSSI